MKHGRSSQQLLPTGLDGVIVNLLADAHEDGSIENHRLYFALGGSSARKLKRGAANRLGGQAMRYELHGLSAGEFGREFDLDRMLNHGYRPRIYQANRPKRRVVLRRTIEPRS